MPLTNGVSSIEVTYEDGEKEVLTSEDWTLYGMQGTTSIPEKMTKLESRTFQASREVAE
jgi:hypothetical protein